MEVVRAVLNNHIREKYNSNTRLLSNGKKKCKQQKYKPSGHPCNKEVRAVLNLYRIGQGKNAPKMVETSKQEVL